MEEKKDEEDSTLNDGEAEVAIAHAKRLVESGVQASNIGIITPYNAQVCYFLLIHVTWTPKEVRCCVVCPICKYTQNYVFGQFYCPTQQNIIRQLICFLNS